MDLHILSKGLEYYTVELHLQERNDRSSITMIYYFGQ